MVVKGWERRGQQAGEPLFCLLPRFYGITGDSGGTGHFGAPAALQAVSERPTGDAHLLTGRLGREGKAAELRGKSSSWVHT